jgi:hypothetical protein
LEILEGSSDPRAFFLKCYRAGQLRIAREVFDALTEVIISASDDDLEAESQ